MKASWIARTCVELLGDGPGTQVRILRFVDGFSVTNTIPEFRTVREAV